MKTIKPLMLIILLLLFSAGYGQEAKHTVDYQSIYNLHPVNLSTGQWRVNFQAGFTHFYKVFNPKMGKIDKINPKIVLNDAYFTAYGIYGLNNKWNLTFTLPFINKHHYTPMLFQQGVGFGDIQLGAVYQVQNLTALSHRAISLELAAGLPTGHGNDLKPTDIPTGLGTFAFTGKVNALFKGKKFDIWSNLYYQYRLPQEHKSVGDEAGLYVLLQKPYKTTVGTFGWETGLNAYYTFPTEMMGHQIPITEQKIANYMIGGWYAYLDKYYIRFGVPYTFYQNGTFLTKYQVLLQLDYQF